MTISKLFCSFLAAIFISFSSIAQDKIETIKVTDNLYMLSGPGGNIGLSIGEDGVFMVDDKFAKNTPAILTAIKEITDQPVKFLLNTHWHGDHTGGNENMEKEGAIIVAHENVRKRMSLEQFNKEGKKTRDAAPKSALPIVTFTQDISFHFNDEDVMIFHIHNAHTDGDAMVYFTGKNVLHMGDTYFQGKYPYIDLKSGGSAQGYIDAHKKALMLIDDETIVIPGHRNISNKKELQQYVAMLEDIKAKIEKAIADGKSEDEVAKDASITKKYDALNYGDWFIKPERIRRTFYLSLKKEK